MNRKIYHKLAACLCVALLLPACAGKGQPASGVAPAQPQSMQDASATTKPAAEGERGYVFPPYTGVGQAPAYAKPVELPGPELIPLDCMLEELDPDKRAEGELFGRSIRYIPFDGIEYVEIPSPIITKNWEGGGAFVAGQNFAAAVWGVDSLNAAVSRDNGESWETVEIDTAPFGSSQKTICFSSRELGWIVVRETEGERALLYTTEDGGESWQRVAFFNSVAWPQCFFASEKVGWLQGVAVEGGEPALPLLETVDGGKSWYPVRLAGQGAGGQDDFGLEQIPIYSPHLGWVLSYTTDWSQPPMNYLAPGQHAMWEPAEPKLELPAGTSYEQLLARMDFVIPKAYSWESGLDVGEMSGFWMACQTEHYIRDNYGEAALRPSPDGYGYIITAEQINEYVYYQYNADAFDATRLDEYDPELGGILHGDGHGGLGENMYLRMVEQQAGGELALYYDVVPQALGATYFYTTGSFYVRVQPRTTPGNQTIYTLVESKALTALPKAQQIHFSV